MKTFQGYPMYYFKQINDISQGPRHLAPMCIMNHGMQINLIEKGKAVVYLMEEMQVLGGVKNQKVLKL